MPALKNELQSGRYKPRTLKRIVVRDPKTRVIHISAFRDRVVHHALVNIIGPIFEKGFIHDSYAGIINKGTSNAVLRFDKFKRKVSGNGRLVNKPKDNNNITGYVLKADIKKYFGSIDHKIMAGIIGKKIKDDKVMQLINAILANYQTRKPGKGMPLGNLTSQFFANVYLNALDCFVKHELKTGHYMRYVDDFILLDKSKKRLEECKSQINNFLKTIKLELHPEKSQAYPLNKGVKFLGFRIFYHYKLLNKKNLRKIELKLKDCRNGLISLDDINKSLAGWFGYSQQANTYNMRNRIKKDNFTLLISSHKFKP